MSDIDAETDDPLNLAEEVPETEDAPAAEEEKAVQEEPATTVDKGDVEGAPLAILHTGLSFAPLLTCVASRCKRCRQAAERAERSFEDPGQAGGRSLGDGRRGRHAEV